MGPQVASAIDEQGVEKQGVGDEATRQGEPMRADEEFVSIPGLVVAAGERYAGREAVVDGDVRLTFPDLVAAMRRSTAAAVAAGLQPGDRASVWAPNMHEWILAALGVLGAGGVLVP